MQLHQLRPVHSQKRAKRIGRGGKRGTYSGRGIKGQRARAGAKVRPAYRDLIAKIPKLRGMGFSSLHEKPMIINVEILERRVSGGSLVSPVSLFKLGLVRKRAGRIPKIKILGEGTLSKPITIQGLSVSRQAREKILAVGGKVIP